MRKSKKNILIAAVTVGLLAIGGGAFAYWTVTGAGTGAASTGVTSGTITVVQTSTVSNLRPGGAAQTLSGNFNNSDTSPVYVATVTAAIGSVVKSGTAPGGACTAADYTLSNAVMTVAAQIQPGTGQGAWTGATLAFNNTGANQDGCQGATVNLTYTIQ